MNDYHDDAPAGPAARRVLGERKNGGIQVTLLPASPAGNDAPEPL